MAVRNDFQVGEVLKSEDLNDTFAASGSPIGTVIAYAGSSAPTGWLLCAGQNVSRTTYADLFTVIGTDYGVGDGSTTFAVPDLRGRVAAGLDNMGGSDAGRLDLANTLGTTAGAQTHTLTVTEMPSHTHTQNPHAHSKTTSTAGSSTQQVQIGSATTTNDAFVVDNTTATNNNTGGDGAHNNLQPTILLNYLIKH
jgi:microcystin-dependent protein